MSIILNSTTPAPPSGAQNVRWQTDMSGNVSGYVTGGSRKSVSFTTGSLAPGGKQNQSGGALTLAKTFILLGVTVNHPARVELYQTAAAQAADSSRPNTTPPTQGSDDGVICDFYLDPTTVPGGTYPATWYPNVSIIGANLESSPASTIAYQITNIDVATETITVTFDILVLEA
jgi:hypothetical protein